MPASRVRDISQSFLRSLIGQRLDRSLTGQRLGRSLTGQRLDRSLTEQRLDRAQFCSCHLVLEARGTAWEGSGPHGFNVLPDPRHHEAFLNAGHRHQMNLFKDFRKT